MTGNDEHTPLERLRDGNRRFVAGNAKRFAADEADQRRELAEGQAPDAVILTCSDSRVPPTLVFDQGLGDLFVIRVAGNVVTPEQLGSIEFAVEKLGSRLVIVLGHTRCGAVTATLDEVLEPSPGLSPNLRALTDRIRPSVESALAAVAEERGDAEPVRLSEDERASVVRDAIRRNVVAAARAIREGSEMLDRLARKQELTILGAKYRLEDGSVEFLD